MGNPKGNPQAGISKQPVRITRREAGQPDRHRDNRIADHVLFPTVTCRDQEVGGVTCRIPWSRAQVRGSERSRDTSHGHVTPGSWVRGFMVRDSIPFL